MLTNTQIKHIISLRQKKFRVEHQQFIVEGIKVLKELLNSEYKTLAVYALPEAEDEIRQAGSIEPVIINEVQLQKMSNLETPNKVLALAATPQKQFDFAEVENELALALDTINDPGNLGTIIRTAAWFGIRTVICSQNTADAWNPKTVQASMGALFRVNVVYADLKAVVRKYNSKNVPVYATTLTGENIYKANLSSTGLIVTGSESHGVSADLLSLIDRKLLIPSFGEGAAESLNAALATAIVCSEFKRRG